MKQSIVLSVVIVFIILSCMQETPRTDSWNAVQANGKGAITLYYVPSNGFAYYDADGNLTGVTADIFRDYVDWIENVYGYELEVQYKSIESWSDFYHTVKISPDGTFGMGNVTITDERWEEIDFSPPYMINIAVLITNEETEELGTLETIAGEFAHLRALAFEGTLHEERINHFQNELYPNLEIDYAHSNDEIIETITSRDEYFAYIDVYNYWRAREAGLPVRRHSVADEPSEQFGFILPDESDWTPVITQFFEEGEGYLNTERYREIMETHLGEELTDLLEEARRN